MSKVEVSVPSKKDMCVEVQFPKKETKQKKQKKNSKKREQGSPAESPYPPLHVFIFHNMTSLYKYSTKQFLAILQKPIKPKHK